MIKDLVLEVALQALVFLHILCLKHFVEAIRADAIDVNFFSVEEPALLHTQWFKRSVFDDLLGARFPQECLHTCRLRNLLGLLLLLRLLGHDQRILGSIIRFVVIFIGAIAQ